MLFIDRVSNKRVNILLSDDISRYYYAVDWSIVDQQLAIKIYRYFNSTSKCILNDFETLKFVYYHDVLDIEEAIRYHRKYKEPEYVKFLKMFRKF